MSEQNSLAISHAPSQFLSVSQVAEQTLLVQEVMRAVMKPGQHYGTIPGCGDKPALFKAGAEKLGVTFRLAFELKDEIIDLGNGHREYRVKTTVTHAPSGMFICQGVGSCSTMEKKYRYREVKNVELTDKPVPKEYWKSKDISLLGGKGFTAKKTDTGWMIAKLIEGERVENPDLADQYNTVWKMAKKRSLVDGTITATGASDCFTQDIEERIGDLEGYIDVPHVGNPSTPAMTKEALKDPNVSRVDPPNIPQEDAKKGRKSSIQKRILAEQGLQTSPEDVDQTGDLKWQNMRIPIGTNTGRTLGEVDHEDRMLLFKSFTPDPKNSAHTYFKAALVLWYKEEMAKETK